uniref:Uncharacterized protein n=1 Tax=Tanacetum cinerariifolium TaxID=118510 RepID=A0A699H835_TANCI|nr:hypothetical protein [Tanacetum cinerariifolium]
MEVPDAMTSDTIKKNAGYKYYMAKKVESEKARIIDKPEEQHVSPIKSGRGKGFMCYGDQVANVPNKLKKDVVPRKTRSLTIAEEAVVGSKASRLESLRQKKQPVAGEGSSATHNKYYSSSDIASDATLHSLSLDKSKESANETDDANESDMELSNDNLHGDDDDSKYGVFMHNKSNATSNSTYRSLTVTSSLLDFIQTFLYETPANELMDFTSHPMYIDALITSVVHNPEGNPELTSYISCASEVPLGTHVDVIATKNFMQKMFPDENVHRIPSLPTKRIPYRTTAPQQSSLQDKAKKLMQKAKKNIRKYKFKKTIAQKFKEYDQKLEALTNFNIYEAFEKSVQAKVLTEIKKLLPIHILNAISNYVKPCLNTSLLESNDTHQQLYDTFYESIILDQDAFHAQDVQSSFYKRSPDNQDPPNNCEGENKKKRQKDVGEPSSRSSRRNRSPVKSGLAKKRTTCFKLFLKSDIDKDENHILGPSTIAIAKKFKELIQKDELSIANLEGTGLEWLKIQRLDDKEYEFSYANLPRLSVNDVEDMYLLQVQDKLHHLPLEFVKDFNNAFLVFIKRIVIKNMVEDIQLGVKIYQRTLNLTKPTMLFEGIDQRIPFIMTATHKGVVYLNQYNIKSPMKLSEVKKFSDGTLVKIQENLIDMLSKNKLGSDNKRLKGRDWTDYDVKSLREMLKKIDEILRHRGQLRRLKEYVGGRPKTVNPCIFVEGELDKLSMKKSSNHELC